MTEGAKRKRGRPVGTGKPYKDEDDKYIARLEIKLLPEQKEAVMQRGGSSWVRDLIEKALL